MSEVPELEPISRRSLPFKVVVTCILGAEDVAQEQLLREIEEQAGCRVTRRMLLAAGLWSETFDRLRNQRRVEVNAPYGINIPIFPDGGPSRV
jgi:hypothetical protein